LTIVNRLSADDRFTTQRGHSTLEVSGDRIAAGIRSVDPASSDRIFAKNRDDSPLIQIVGLSVSQFRNPMASQYRGNYFKPDGGAKQDDRKHHILNRGDHEIVCAE